MATAHSLFNSLQTFDVGDGRKGLYYSLPALESAGLGKISRLPVSIRIVLESVLRNVDGQRVTETDVRTLANWNARAPAPAEIPFVVARIVLQDFTGVPLLVDLAAMRSAIARRGKDPQSIEPLVPVDLVVDHSVQVDFFGTPEALQANLEMEFQRNRERYQLLKWGQQAFRTFRVVPPGIGIVHQVNLEYLAKGVLSRKSEISNLKSEIFYPDTLVGTDSHTTMINGLGIVGWGVGGIEAEAGMLGQPVYFLTPEVVGVHLSGSLSEGVTATDLALHITQMLRKAKVVGKFVEFYGPGAARLPVADRATVANMAPEYGATMGFFPVDDESLNYLRATGRTRAEVVAFGNYFKAQDLWGIPKKGQIDYSVDLDLDLGDVRPSVAGPKRPQDRIELQDLKAKFGELLAKPAPDGYGKSGATLPAASPSTTVGTQPGGQAPVPLAHGSVVIAAITSCTNTSNPSVMLAAGLLAKKAVERGLTVPSAVKTSLAPGSRVVTDYLTKAGLQPYLDRLGFNLVGYGCTTCIGNSGPLPAPVEEAIAKNDLVAASVLSGNRNFEARVHGSVKANFLMSPPLVVAFALAGRVDIDLTTDPIQNGVYLKDLWPTLGEIRDAMRAALKPEVFRALYQDFAAQNPLWNEIPAPSGAAYQWDPDSTYIQEPPFFADRSGPAAEIADLRGARALAIFGDSVTTDHISPAGNIPKESPAGRYLIEHGVSPADFNSYGARRGNDRVMTRGTFANVRIKNLMVPGVEGGVTKYIPVEGETPVEPSTSRRVDSGSTESRPPGGAFQSADWRATLRGADHRQRADSGSTESRPPDSESAEIVSIYDAAMKYQAANVPLVVIAGAEYGTGSSRDWAAKGTRLLGVRAVVATSFERIHRSNLIGMGVLPCQFAEGTSARTLGLGGTETYDITGLDGGLKPRLPATLVVHRNDGRTEQVPVIVRIDTPIEVEYYRAGGILPYVLAQLLAKM